eukprot:6011987-Pleurochrysis_carterae.AAC.1
MVHGRLDGPNKARGGRGESKSVALWVKYWRIEGATDTCDRMGDARKTQVQQRGRWDSDVSAVYQSALVDRQVQVSADMAESTGVDMHAICEKWVQP